MIIFKNSLWHDLFREPFKIGTLKCHPTLQVIVPAGTSHALSHPMEPQRPGSSILTPPITPHGIYDHGSLLPTSPPLGEVIVCVPGWLALLSSPQSLESNCMPHPHPLESQKPGSSLPTLPTTPMLSATTRVLLLPSPGDVNVWIP